MGVRVGWGDVYPLTNYYIFYYIYISDYCKNGMASGKSPTGIT